jgi:hypothetical protein
VPRNRPPKGCCLWPEFNLPLLHSMAHELASIGCSKLARTHPLPQLLAHSFSCPSAPLPLTCSTSQMRMCPLTLIPFLYLISNHLSCFELYANSASKAPRRCAPLSWTPQSTHKPMRYAPLAWAPQSTQNRKFS